MEGKLIKRGEGDYRLFVNDAPYAQSKFGPYKKLSLKNCEAIERGYDLDELAKNFAIKELADPNDYEHSIYASTIENAYMSGFQKALELLGGKKYTENDLYRAFLINSAGNNDTLRWFFKHNVLPTFKQTEWDVEIEMEHYVKYVPKTFETVYPTGGVRPVLDADDCLILKLNK